MENKEQIEKEADIKAEIYYSGDGSTESNYKNGFISGVNSKIAERIRIEYAIGILEGIYQNNTGQDSLIEIENKITELKNKIDGK